MASILNVYSTITFCELTNCPLENKLTKYIPELLIVNSILVVLFISMDKTRFPNRSVTIKLPWVTLLSKEIIMVPSTVGLGYKEKF